MASPGLPAGLGRGQTTTANPCFAYLWWPVSRRSDLIIALAGDLGPLIKDQTPLSFDPLLGAIVLLSPGIPDTVPSIP